MNLYQELALMTDAEAELCLNGILKGLAVAQPEYADLFTRPTEMATVVRQAAGKIGKPAVRVVEVPPQQRPKVVRTILCNIAENPTLKVYLEAWLKSARPKLLEPVTTALVLAGIVFVLSTDIKVVYAKKGKKKELRVEISKKPTNEKILGTLLGLIK